MAAAHARKVAIARNKVGGTCVIRGCVAKKLLSMARICRGLTMRRCSGDISTCSFNGRCCATMCWPKFGRLEGLYEQTCEP